MKIDENTYLKHKRMKVYSLETNSVVKRKWFLDLLTCMFGVGSWILVNSLYTQFPLLVQNAPEGWDLPSYISIAVQTGNLGPLLYSAWRKKYGNQYDRPLIILVLILGIISMFLMAMFYDVYGIIFGKPHSIILCILTFAIALVGCTSSVLFIPSLSHYSDIYLVTFMIGEGLSSFVPSLIAIGQGIGTTTCKTFEENGRNVTKKAQTEANFSSGFFFAIIGTIMCLSAVSYLFLEYLPKCKKEKIQIKPENDEVHGNITKSTRNSNIILLVIQGIIVFFSNGFMPSIQTYACLPYGYMAYHLATNLSNMANPIACFIAFFTNRTSKSVIYVLFSICIVSTMYMLMAAISSPSSLLNNSTIGAILIVFIWVLFVGCVSYVKLSIAAVLRNEGNKGLFHYGCITQIGSILGALIAFYLINVLKILKQNEPCK